MRTYRMISGAVALATAGLLVAGCGSSSSSKPESATTVTSAAVATTAPATSGTSTGGATAVVTTATTPLGEILVDSKGMTLYVYAKDTTGKSNCNAGCATAWPPLTGAVAQAGGSVAASSLTVITRDDGSKQIAINGQPLYTFASDTAAGDTNGQGVGGVWFVVQPDGTPVKAG